MKNLSLLFFMLISFIIAQNNSTFVLNTETRSQANIVRTLRKNTPQFKGMFECTDANNCICGSYVYITVGVNGQGVVTQSDVVQSTTGDTVIDNTVENIVKSWKFDRLINPQDTTYLTEPFYIRLVDM